MQFLFWNFLEDLAAEPVPSPAFDTLYPARYLYDRLPSKPGRFGSVTADPYIPIDGNLLKGGGFETDVELALWTDISSGGGSTLRTTTAGEFNTTGSSPSTAAIKLTTSGAGSVAGRYRDKKVKLGHSINVTVAAKGDGTRTARARIQILELGVYLTSSGTWSASPQDYYTRATNSFAVQTSLGVALPALPTGRGDLARRVTIRATAYNNTTSGGSAEIDDFFIWASPSAASLHGHNLASGITCEIYKGGTAYAEGSLTLVATLTPKALSFGGSFTEINDRWLRFKFPGTNPEEIWIGEATLGKLFEISPSAIWPLRASYLLPQSRSDDGAFSYPLEDSDRRQLRPLFRRGLNDTPATTTAYDDFREFRDTFLRACGYGSDPMVAVVPTEADPEAWIYTRGPMQVDVDQGAGDVWDVSQLEMFELPFPSWVPS